ncbi:MAG TPA: hypothetical protein VG122_20700 [Gemmata sp.]|nr:hypothetical protein [Gemmata sp.]
MQTLRSSIGVRGFVLVVVLGMCGCSNKGDLSGTVSYQGQKLQFGTVQVRTSDGLVQTTQIDPTGTYHLTDVSVGRAIIAVTCLDPRQSEHTRSLINGGQTRFSGAVGRGRSTPLFLIPEKYSDLDRSELETTITGGDSVFEIELH